MSNSPFPLKRPARIRRTDTPIPDLPLSLSLPQGDIREIRLNDRDCLNHDILVTFVEMKTDVATGVVMEGDQKNFPQVCQNPRSFTIVTIPPQYQQEIYFKFGFYVRLVP